MTPWPTRSAPPSTSRAQLVLDSPFVMLGDTTAMVDHVQRLRSAGVSYVVAFAERGAADLAPVIERLR